MPQVSRIPLNKRLEAEILENLELVMAKLSHKEDMKGFLFSLLTRTEKLMLAKRLAIVILLREGISHSNVAASLKVTRATVSRIELIGEARGEGFKLALKKYVREQNLNDLKNGLIKLSGYSIRAAGGRVKPTVF